MEGIKAGILTASDRCHAGVATDVSGKLIEKIITGQLRAEVCCYKIVPDDEKLISEALTDMADNLGMDLILTTGGTGIARRDFTPEATRAVIDKEIPGIAEAMRKKSLEITPFAMLSRATAGVRNETLIINLPGSPKAVEECMEVLLPVLPHALRLIKGMVKDCCDEQKTCEGHEHSHSRECRQEQHIHNKHERQVHNDD